MERRSYTRLTLALDIVGRIPDGPFMGLHELATIKHQIDLHDIICIEPHPFVSIECDNPQVPCDESNICHKALTLLQDEFGIDEPVRISITKNIPVMGGLAGGSANAATTLMMLNDIWSLGLSTEQLSHFGRRLGMDVPFYFIGGTAFDSEAGGVCSPLCNRCSFTFILAIPDFGVSTAEAYKGIDYATVGRNRASTERMATFFLEKKRDAIVSCVHNDFERSVFSRYPQLMSVKREMLDAGCEAAVLSGSGSTLLGITDNIESALAIGSKISCRTITASTLVR